MFSRFQNVKQKKKKAKHKVLDNLLAYLMLILNIKHLDELRNYMLQIGLHLCLVFGSLYKTINIFYTFLHHLFDSLQHRFFFFLFLIDSTF